MGKTKDSHKETFMTNVTVDLSKTIGKIKPMHATNNGPKHKFAADQRVSNLGAFKEAGIPYARNHDAAFCADYGGEHTVDVNNIFTNFDADPYDPASYDFVLTDEYLQVIELSGAKVFYRLGSKIEHWRKKYNTLPPKDFKKWAVICEHISHPSCVVGFFLGIMRVRLRNCISRGGVNLKIKHAIYNSQVVAMVMAVHTKNNAVLLSLVCF